MNQCHQSITNFLLCIKLIVIVVLFLVSYGTSKIKTKGVLVAYISLRSLHFRNSSVADRKFSKFV